MSTVGDVGLIISKQQNSILNTKQCYIYYILRPQLQQRILAGSGGRFKVSLFVS